MSVNKINISRKNSFGTKVVFVDGLPGCGKSLFSRIIAALDRVELLNYATEIEHCCALSFLGKLSMDAAKTLIRIQTDLQLYKTMMSRELNFRPSDMSSVFKDHNPARYFERIFKPGDELIPDIISKEKPILNLAVHNLLAFSEPIWQGLGKRCVFVEVARHPLYMIRQNELNMQKLIGDARYFAIHFSYKNHDYPYYVWGWEDIFHISNPMEQTIHFIDQYIKRRDIEKEKLKEKYQAEIITIPFELFVLEPLPWLQQIASALETEITDSTKRVMLQQNVPRDKIAQGIDLDIYRRCGWVPQLEGASEQEELDIRREDVSNVVGKNVISILDRLSEDYEKKYMSNILE